MGIITWHNIGSCYFTCYRLLILLLLLVNFFCLCNILPLFEQRCAGGIKKIVRSKNVAQKEGF